MAISQAQVVENLRNYFMERGLRQRAVAQIIGAQDADVSRMLSTGKIGKTMARKLSVGFGMSVNYLLYGLGEMMIPQSNESDLLPITGKESNRQLDIIAKDAIKTAHKDAKDIIIDQLNAKIEAQNADILTLRNTILFAMKKLEEAEAYNKEMGRKISALLDRWGDATGMEKEEVEAIFNAGGQP